MSAVAAADHSRRRRRPASHRYRHRFLPRARATQTLAGPVMAAARPTTAASSVIPPSRHRAEPRAVCPALRTFAEAGVAREPSFRRSLRVGGLPMPDRWLLPAMAAGGQPGAASSAVPPSRHRAGRWRSRPLQTFAGLQRRGSAWLPAFPMRLAALRRRTPSTAPVVAVGSANHQLRCRLFHQAGTAPTVGCPPRSGSVVLGGQRLLLRQGPHHHLA